MRDDVTNTDVTNITGAKTVADLAAAGTCNADATGEIVLNADDGALYVCNGKKWITMKGDAGDMGETGEPGAAGSSCTAAAVDGGFQLTCGGEVVGVISNGADGGQGPQGEEGPQGAQGEPGTAGASCTAVELQSGDGIEISCGGQVVGVIMNGTNGAQGEQGPEGPQGQQGPEGPQGEQGPEGPQGEQGPEGPQGQQGEPGTSCTASAVSGGFELICGGQVVGVIMNGTNGAQGEQGPEGPQGEQGPEGPQGQQGEPGTSCTGRSIAGVGIEISCGGEVIDTLRNGAQGEQGPEGPQGEQGPEGPQGQQGEPGTSCTARSIAGVGVEVSCDGVVIDTLRNGAQGEQGPEGPQGQQGEPGASCTGRTIDGVGVEISCGGVVIDTLKNGAPGNSNVVAGNSCTGRMVDGEDIEITCNAVVVDTLTSELTTLFDMSVVNQGVGLMDVDGSWFSDSASAVVVAEHSDGNWYPVGRSLPIAECPIQDPGETEYTYCYYGWNAADMVTDNSFKVGVKLMKYASESGFGFTNGGLLYVLDGTQLNGANPVNVGSVIVLKVKVAAGKAVSVYAIDNSWPYDVNEGVAKTKFTGTGDWQDVVLLTSNIAPYSGAANTFNPAATLAIAVEYEYAATSVGQSCSQCSNAVMDLEWQSLKVWR